MPTNSPPAYASIAYTGPNILYGERSPLIPKQKNRVVRLAYLAILIVLFGLGFFLFTLYGPYIMSGVAAERKKWDKEIGRNREQEQSRIREWERMFKERQNLERSREVKWHREEEERQRLGLYWGEPTPDLHCAAYNTREYWAPLLNTVAYEYNWLKPCQSIPTVIHGKNITTSRCLVNGSNAYGYWMVDFDEPICAPYWDQFKDKGCTAIGSGQRRVEAHLEGVHDGDDGEKLCASTPNDFYGKHFDGPHTCVNWGNNGIFGIWNVDDFAC